MQQPLPLKGKIISLVPVVGIYNISADIDVGTAFYHKVETQLFRIHAWALVEYDDGSTQVEPMILGSHGLKRVVHDRWKVILG